MIDSQNWVSAKENLGPTRAVFSMYRFHGLLLVPIEIQPFDLDLRSGGIHWLQERGR